MGTAAATLMQATTPSRAIDAKGIDPVRLADRSRGGGFEGGAEHGEPLPRPPGYRPERARAPRRAGMRPGQPGVDPALLEEDEPARVDRGQAGAPRRALGNEVGPVLLGRAAGFSRTSPSRLSVWHKVGPLTRTPVRSASRSAYAISVKAFAFATRRRRTSRALPSNRGAEPPACGLAPRPALLPRLLLPAVERGRVHPEQSDDPRPAQPAALAGAQRPLAQVRRIGSWHAEASPGQTKPTAQT